jgi:type I restriction enzyme M protein
MPRRKLLDNQPTTTQRLNSIIKSCRDTMRKDRGLSSDIDRLPMLTAFMFLKFIDDKEKILEAESTPLSPYRPWIDPPYRWRDWASDTEDSTEQNLHLLTGDDLISFVYDAKFIFPSGQEEAGLIQYLRNLRSDNGRKQRDVIAAIYSDFHYRMVSGHLFREMINKLEGLNFTSTDEIHTLSHIYETMLKQMRDAAGDSGEFYTPRPIVKFMVKAMNPKLGETVLDPACGTGGFLVESFRHLYSQVRTTKDMDILQECHGWGSKAAPLYAMSDEHDAP